MRALIRVGTRARGARCGLAGLLDRPPCGATRPWGVISWKPKRLRLVCGSLYVRLGVPSLFLVHAVSHTSRCMPPAHCTHTRGPWRSALLPAVSTVGGDRYVCPFLFDFLTVKEVGRAACVCRSWRAGANDDELWRELYQRTQVRDGIEERGSGVGLGVRKVLRVCSDVGVLMGCRVVLLMAATRDEMNPSRGHRKWLLEAYSTKEPVS